MNRINRKIILHLSWSLLLLGTSAKAQYFNFSQYSQTPQRVNPAHVAASDYEQANLIYRNQNTAADFDINSSNISYQRPFRFSKKQRHFLGFGISALDDRTGGSALLNKQDIGLTTGLNIKLDETQTLNFGVSGMLKRLNFSLDGLETGFQYQNSNGSTLSSFIGEDFVSESKTTIGVNAGVLWEKKDKNGRQIAQFGWAIYDLNQPGEFLKGGNNYILPRSNLFQLGIRAFNNDKLSVYPQLLVLLSGKVLNINSGITWEYTLPEGKKFSKLVLQTNYVVSSYGSIGFRLSGEKYSAGMSYDLGFASTQVANAGAIEISFAYHKLVREKRKPATIIAEAEAKDLQDIDEVVIQEDTDLDNVDTLSVIMDTLVNIKEEVVETELEIPVVKNDSANAEMDQESSDVTILSEYSPGTSVGELIYSNVRMERLNIICEFDFNKSELKQEVQSYLNELGEELKGQNIIAIEIIGHTDAVGPADYNMNLSTERAHSIAAFLAKQGIPWDKLSVTGKGESQPLPGVTNDRENRRVEVLIFSQKNTE